MTSKVSVSLIQFDAKVLEPETNLERMRAAILSEAKTGAQLIVFPELSNTGYVEPLTPGAPFSPDSGGSDQYAFRLFQAAEPVNGPFITSLCDLARAHSLHVVAGLALRHPVQQGVMLNASILIGPQGVLGVYHKIHRWHLEKLYFIAGQSISVQRTPLGPIGMQICYDIRFPELTRALMLQGAQIVTNIWASFRPKDKPLEDEQIFTHRAYTRATENGVFFLSCNRAGTQGHCAFMGRSVIVAPDGKVLAQSTSEDEDVIRAEIDLDDVARYRSYVGLATDRRTDLYSRYLTAPI
ncbi:carbon-nitrogen hydrolase family protein [Bradyrhizobium huanghuaihaiense]|uniref:carbon-nitrogen hydrolase family protein n=1 Tax=Bradyrhizobium huanghuaihaiense TaxID=990078 RepID=UPI0021AA5180|nr:carbon-nitrogen hydrolase family protein [Bradyrhizobium sp. CB3035]UWU73181.1 carbon-nitrogen hydrolase family protein [Bradyrhizobium sp. CB3035]